MDAEYYLKMPFDSPVWAALLVQVERAAPQDMAAWREAEVAEFAANVGGSRGLPDRALMERLIGHLRNIVRSDDKFAAPTAFSRLRGHVLRPSLADHSGPLPEEARGRMLLTEPRTITDRELIGLFTAYRDDHAKAYAAWRAALIKVDKTHRLHPERHAPLTVALEDELDQSDVALANFLQERCWIQSRYALTTASSDLCRLLMHSIPAHELALTPADAALHVALPSDEDVLAFLEGYGQAPDERHFAVTARNALELRALMDFTAEAMATERKANWDARATSRSSDAGYHAACFRMMRELHEQVRAAWEATQAPRP